MANSVPHSHSPTLVATLGDPVKIRNWQIAGKSQWDNIIAHLVTRDIQDYLVTHSQLRME